MVLNSVISKLSGKLVVLASASPRRQEILRNAVCFPLVKLKGIECISGQLHILFDCKHIKLYTVS